MFKSFQTAATSAFATGFAGASAAVQGASDAVSVAAHQAAEMVEPTVAPRPMENNPDWVPRKGSVLYALFMNLPVFRADAQDMGSFLAGNVA